MAKIQIVSIENEAIGDPTAAAHGTVDVRSVFAGDRDPLHMTVYRLGVDAALTIAGEHCDFMAYVWRGAARVGGRKMERRSSFIVEKGAETIAKGTENGAVIVIFNLRGQPRRSLAGGHVFLLPSDRVPRSPNMDDSGVGAGIHADASLPSSEIWLHENDFFKPGYEVGVHSHTEDEIIFVRDGSIRLGNRLSGPGTALAVRANTKYSFHAGPNGLSFINFRATSPVYVAADGSRTVDEAKLFKRELGSPHYLEPIPY